MTPKGEELTQEGEIPVIFGLKRKITHGFSAQVDVLKAENSSSQKLQLIFVVKGTLKFYGSLSKKPLAVLTEQQHNLVLIGDGIQWKVEDAVHELICLEIEHSFLERYLPTDHLGLLNLKKGYDKNQFGVFSTQNLHINPEILTILNNLKTANHTGFCERLFLEAKVLELLMFQSSQFELINENAELRQLKPEEMNRMLAVKDILVNNIDHPFSLRDLAHMVGTNEFNLKRNFKIAFGTTVYGYLNQYKMEMAKTMLLEKDITIAEISTKMGYTYPTHFSSAFKKYFGYLPNKLKSGKLSVLIFAFDFSWIGEFLLVI
ncbi:MAG: AraC family transcriptional regulator [Flavobacterium sp.]|nr:MAG: AraC family transcriptional regulator [Flavobacterium sp.]